MTNKKSLILDCDGVLYPTSQLELKEFVTATERASKSFGITEQQYLAASKRAKDNNAPGLGNFIKEMAEHNEDTLRRLSEAVVANVDYSRITRDDALLRQIHNAKKNFDVFIFTNNCKEHLDIILNKRFGTSIKDIGIDCYDVASTEKGGKFHPKQSEIGLKLFTQKINRHPSQCILIDDAKRNIDCAFAINMGGILITEEYNLSKCLKDLSANTPNTLYRHNSQNKR